MPLSPYALPLAQSNGTREFIDDLARTPLSHVVLLVVFLSVLRLALYPTLSKTPPHMRLGAYPLLRYANEILDALVYAAVFVFMIIRPFAIQAFLIPSGSMWPTLYVNDFIVANKAIYRYTEPQHGDIVVFRPPIDATDPTQRDSDGQVKVDFIKRCIGVPGDLIELKKGVLYRNGQKVDEPYTHLSVCTEQVGQECLSFRDYNESERADFTLESFKLVNYNGSLIPLNYTDRDANARDPARDSYGALPPYGVAEKFQIADPEEQKRAVALPAEKIPPGYFLMMGDNRNNSFDSRGWGLVPRDAVIGRSEFIWLPLSRWRISR